MTLVQTLEQARARIAQGWCQDAYARNASGDEVHKGSDAACQWCLAGALPDLHGSHYHILLGLLRTPNLMTWNDDPSRTQQDVLDLYDKAIKMAKEESE